MKTSIAFAALVSLIPGTFAALTINTPTNAVQCQPLLLSWVDGQPPYFLSVLPGGQAAAPPLKSFPTQNGTSLTWPKVDIQAGVGITLALKDNTGAQAFSDIVTILTSSDNSCVNSAVSISGSAGAGGAGPTGGASPTSGSSASGGANSGASASKSGSAASSTASKASAGTRSSVASVGLAGVIGLVGAALL
ncbi:hypothetical protein BD779DRAFT_1495003 [Infundibulicybe gibba]|nr:hypothetical protein BD779DRAFT_1495003 [Infundibulicybe gibba]